MTDQLHIFRCLIKFLFSLTSHNTLHLVLYTKNLTFIFIQENSRSIFWFNYSIQTFIQRCVKKHETRQAMAGKHEFLKPVANTLNISWTIMHLYILQLPTCNSWTLNMSYFLSQLRNVCHLLTRKSIVFFSAIIYMKATTPSYPKPLPSYIYNVLFYLQ